VPALALMVLLAGCGTGNEYLLGQDLFEQSCSVCHGPAGLGGIGVDIGPGSDAAINLSDEQIAGTIVVGPGNMPGFKRLSDEQVASLVEYVRRLQGK